MITPSIHDHEPRPPVSMMMAPMAVIPTMNITVARTAGLRLTSQT
jgi:hypothetical protein